MSAAQMRLFFAAEDVCSGCDQAPHDPGFVLCRPCLDEGARAHGYGGFAEIERATQGTIDRLDALGLRWAREDAA